MSKFWFLRPPWVSVYILKKATWRFLFLHFGGFFNPFPPRTFFLIANISTNSKSEKNFDWCRDKEGRYRLNAHKNSDKSRFCLLSLCYVLQIWIEKLKITPINRKRKILLYSNWTISCRLRLPFGPINTTNIYRGTHGRSGEAPWDPLSHLSITFKILIFFPINFASGWKMMMYLRDFDIIQENRME